jgi:hypothetical protein
VPWHYIRTESDLLPSLLFLFPPTRELPNRDARERCQLYEFVRRKKKRLYVFLSLKKKESATRDLVSCVFIRKALWKFRCSRSSPTCVFCVISLMFMCVIPFMPSVTRSYNSSIINFYWHGCFIVDFLHTTFCLLALTFTQLIHNKSTRSCVQSCKAERLWTLFNTIYAVSKMKSLFSSLKYVFGNVYHVLCFPRPRWDVEVFFGISLYERLVNCHEF